MSAEALVRELNALGDTACRNESGDFFAGTIDKGVRLSCQPARCVPDRRRSLQRDGANGSAPIEDAKGPAGVRPMSLIAPENDQRFAATPHWMNFE